MRTLGADVARTAIVLGQPLIPWQRHAADVLGTLRPDGRLRYRRGVLIVPRRAGKTWFLFCWALTLARYRSMFRGFYAGPRRETAAALWRDEWFPMLEVSPLSPRYVRIRRSNGSEAVTFRHNRSTFRLMPPDGDAMRSLRANLAIVDEGREFSLEQGLAFERAVFPTQATGWGGQFDIVSNAGTGESEWLRRWRDLGRASITDPRSQIAHIEYAAPDGAPIDSPDTWAAAHPGIGYHLLLDALEADCQTMPPDDFAAEYLGIWPETRVDTELVAGWRAGVVAEASLGSPVVFALEVSLDRDRFVLVAAGTSTSGRPAVALLVDVALSPAWPTLLADEVARWRPIGLAFDAAGPVAALRHELAGLPVNLFELGTRDATAAAGAFYDRVTAPGGVEHGDDPELELAVAAARRRDASGSWLFDRRATAALPVLAASAAVWRWSDGRSRPPTVS